MAFKISKTIGKMEIKIKTKQREYPIVMEKGALKKAVKIIDRASDVFIVHDSGIPAAHVDTLKEQLPNAPIHVFEHGESSKNLSVYGDILRWLADNRATRNSMIVALGGGVTGDMAGFAAATYMRGIEYINIPTTTLSQIDSSIGGKTAIDLDGIKNLVGAFHQPSAVIIDSDLLKTLPARQFDSGLVEAVKAGVIADPELFGIFEKDDFREHIDEVILKAVKVKQEVVEQDEIESSLRKILNFGHTIGHAYETYYKGEYLHGECVALGMMKVMQDEIMKDRLGAVLSKLEISLPKAVDVDAIVSIIKNDKKSAADGIDMVFSDKIGSAYIKNCSIDEIRGMLK